MSNDLGQYLRLLREQQGLSTRQAAAALECSHSLIARFETGDRTPGIDRLWRLVELLAGDFGQARMSNQNLKPGKHLRKHCSLMLAKPQVKRRFVKSNDLPYNTAK